MWSGGQKSARTTIFYGPIAVSLLVFSLLTLCDERLSFVQAYHYFLFLLPTRPGTCTCLPSFDRARKFLSRACSRSTLSEIVKSRRKSIAVREPKKSTNSSAWSHLAFVPVVPISYLRRNISFVEISSSLFVVSRAVGPYDFNEPSQEISRLCV